MRTVRLTHACWLNDRVHGEEDDPLTLDDDEAAVHVRSGLAVYTDGPQPEGTPAVPVVPDSGTSLTPDDNDFGQDPRFILEDAERARVTQPEVKRPYGNASKAAWVDWAVHNGADAVEAASLTKNELMSRYGEAL